MNKIYTYIGLTLLALAISFSSVYAVSLQARIDYMQNLKNQAEDLEQQGYYDESARLSLEVQRLAAEIDTIIALLKKWQLLEKNIAVAKQVRADLYSPEEYNLAVEFYKYTEQGFIDEDYEQADFDVEEGLYYIDIAINNSRDEFIKNRQQVKRDNNEPHNLEVVEQGDREYVVRLIPERRDSLWRIAEYAYIYDNPWEWKRIYHANRNIIDDPDLIYPGQHLVIPPIIEELDLE